MRALLAVSDRTGLTEFARGLQQAGVSLYATDGTQRYLETEGVVARGVAELTGFPALLGGRVKSLHPAIFAGILARRGVDEDMQEIAGLGTVPFDLVVVNLYPFSAAVAAGDEAAIVENIDIGGPSMIRAAAKNHASVAVVVSPVQYSAVLAELQEKGGWSIETRRDLAAQAFAHTAFYETNISRWFADELGTDYREEDLPEVFLLGVPQRRRLRYGENPHQRGALYAAPLSHGLAHAVQHQGVELSFTNWLDADAAWRLVNEFLEPAAAVIKHTNPAGFALGENIGAAYRKAYAADPRSAFGGIVGLNRPLDAECAAELSQTFLEVVVAPALEPEAAAILARKERLRVLTVEQPSCAEQFDIRSIDGGLLVQTMDRTGISRASMQVPTVKQPTAEQWEQLLIAWRVCRHVKSNAIVLVKDGVAVGVGAGQMSRVEAAELAVQRAHQHASGSVAASDAFFPMPDGLETLATAGIAALIQPGGSKKDAEVIAAADALGIAMVFTGERHFRH